MPSLKPSTFVAGGVVPVDQNLLWTKCRWGNFDYTKKDGTVVATTFAALIKVKNDAGEEYDLTYSAGDPAKWSATEDGKKPVNADNPDASFSSSSNFFLLMNNLVSAGFPENRLPDDGDISKLEGLYAYHIGLTEPKRQGLTGAEPRADGRERVISVPSKVLKLPGDKATTKAAPKTGSKATATESSADVNDKLGKFVAEQVTAAGGTITRQKVATALFKTYAKDPDKDAMAGLIFKPEFQVVLLANGLSLDGENITATE